MSQGKRVNIPRSVKDSHYRYTMPAIEAKVEGSGNGIKTRVVNLADVAKSLNREAADILKMFGFELGAVTIKDEAKDTYIVNGKFSANELADVLDVFIDKFVLCGSCRNPETFIVPSKGIVKLRCISCGNETQADAKHKLTDFVLKDAARRKLKAKQEAMAAAESKGKGKSKKKSKKGGKSSSSKSDPEDDDEATEWSVDVSSAAVKARRRAALGIPEEGGDAKTVAAAPHKSLDAEFVEYVNGSGPLDQQRLRQLRDGLRLSPSELASRIANTVFEPDLVMKQIIPKASRWAAFFSSSRKNQDALIVTMVEMALVKEDTLLPNLATLLKGLYDHDYVEEEAILEWYESVPMEDERLLKAKLKTAPLAKWFQEAEEEEE